MEPPVQISDPSSSTSQAFGVSPFAIFTAFFRLGLTAFGGPAMVAYMHDLAVLRKRWLTEESFQNGVVLCQTIPGATAMQTAAYVGLRANGIAGALAAYIGFMLPAFVLMFVLSAIYATTRDVPQILAAFSGLRVIVVAIIASAVIGIGRKTITRLIHVPVALVSSLLLGFGGSPGLVILAAGLVGLLLPRNAASPVSATTRTTVPPRTLRAVALGILCVALTVIALFFAAPRLAWLALIMMKVDVLGFGGGFASVPLMMHEIVDARHWMDRAIFMDGIALGQVTPGPIVITATFVGYQLHGWAGALVGTLGIFATSFLVVLLAVPYFDRLYRSEWFRRAVRGVLIAFVGLLLAVAVQFGLAVTWSWPAIALGLAAFAALRFKVDILWVVLVGAILSVFVL
jgi:chromate transporter